MRDAAGDGLPLPAALRRDYAPILARFEGLCRTDPRIVAGFIGGSSVRGEDDVFSDVDLCLVLTHEAHDDVVAGREALIRRLGEPLFIEDFGLEGVVFAIMAGGEEIELHLARVETLDRTLPRPIRVLFDDEGVLEGATLPTFAIERQEEHGALRRIVTWFWHDLSHFTAAIGRGEPWWAAGQLEVLRTSCVNLIRIERGIGAQDDAYEKLDRSMTGGELDALSSTYVPLEIEEMLHAGLVLLRFFRSRAPEVAAIHGVPYPAALDRVMGARLEALAAHLGS